MGELSAAPFFDGKKPLKSLLTRLQIRSATISKPCYFYLRVSFFCKAMVCLVASNTERVGSAFPVRPIESI